MCMCVFVCVWVCGGGGVWVCVWGGVSVYNCLNVNLFCNGGTAFFYIFITIILKYFSEK